MPEALDVKKLGLYLVEGFVELSPLGQPLVRSEDSDGREIVFDPSETLKQFNGKEVRVVIVPLASVVELEAFAKKLEENGQPVTLGDSQ